MQMTSVGEESFVTNRGCLHTEGMSRRNTSSQILLVRSGCMDSNKHLLAGNAWRNQTNVGLPCGGFPCRYAC